MDLQGVNQLFWLAGKQ